MQLRRILAPTDFSAPSLAAVRDALALAKRLGAELEIVHVCPLLVHAIAPGAVPDAPTFEADLRARLKTDVDTLVGELSGHGVDVTGKLVVGHPAREIVCRAEGDGCDLIVMATHGRTGFQRFALGSVAEHVLRLSSVPVLTARSAP
jgi:nucleotide-binding universal stress UspA family protein